MKKLVLTLFTFLAFESFGQTPEINPLGKISVGLTFSPDYCFRSLRASGSSQWIADSRDEQEKAKFGFTAGGSILYTLSNRVSFESGLLFSDKGEKTKKLSYRFTDPGDGNAPTFGEHHYHYYYLDVPVKANYYLTPGRIKAFVSAGTSVNVFLTQKRSSTYTFSDGRTEDRSQTSNPGFTRINVAALAGFGVDYTVTENLQVRVEPIYRRSITSVINAPIKGFLYSAGVNFGAYIKL